MSYLVLARKYRPQTFEQVVQQEHVTQTLANAIAAQRMAHAILFAGPRGTGKTTIARILAKAMNCAQGPAVVPCNRCRSCTEITSGHSADVFEIDGASNNGVDHIRELRANVNYMPAHSAYKIYIIDEVHMLSTPAFNALLKTLEEPPAHVIFLFATTEPQKIPVTILSRCQRHDLRRIDSATLGKHMQSLCRLEEISIDDRSLAIIAREAGGSMRDALSLLDQVIICSQGDIHTEQVLSLLGVIDGKAVFDMAATILAGDLIGCLQRVDQVYRWGHDIREFYGQLMEHFRNLVVVKMGPQGRRLVDTPAADLDLLEQQVAPVTPYALQQTFTLLAQAEASIRLSAQPKLALEMLLVRIFQIKPSMPIDTLIEKIDGLVHNLNIQPEPAALTTTSRSPHDGSRADRVDLGAQAPGDPLSTETAAGAGAGHAGAADAGAADAGVADAGVADTGAAGAGTSSPRTNCDPADAWTSLMAVLQSQHPGLAANLETARISRLGNDSVEIEVNGPAFNLNMVGRDKNLRILRKVCRNYFNTPMKVTLKGGQSPDGEALRQRNKQNGQLKKEALGHPLVADAIEIFEGKVVEVKLSPGDV